MRSCKFLTPGTKKKRTTKEVDLTGKHGRGDLTGDEITRGTTTTRVDWEIKREN